MGREESRAPHLGLIWGSTRSPSHGCCDVMARPTARQACLAVVGANRVQGAESCTALLFPALGVNLSFLHCSRALDGAFLVPAHTAPLQSLFSPVGCVPG